MAEDLLLKIFTRQAEIQQDTFGHRFPQMTDAEKIVFIKEMVLACSHELHEAMRETGWKGWSTSRHINLDPYVQELVDALLLLVNLFLVTGYSPEALTAFVSHAVSDKQLLNIQRQKSGY